MTSKTDDAKNSITWYMCDNFCLPSFLIKRHWTLLLSLKIIVSIKEEKKWRAADSIKHCEKQLALQKCRSFWERGNFSLKKIKDFRPEAFIRHMKAHTIYCATRVCFLSLFSCNFDAHLSKNFHRLVILRAGLWQ